MKGCKGMKGNKAMSDYKKIAYIAGPYRASSPRGIIQNIRAAEAVAIKYWQQGYAVICPHKNSALFDGLASEETWLSGYLAILARCDVCIMVSGWQESEDARQEHDFARDHGIEVIYDQAVKVA
jgi:hypothetical protein